MSIVVPRSEIASYRGKSLGTGEWFAIDQHRINQFADITFDHQYIHVDLEKAKQTPFGGTIAHGFLTLSLLPFLAKDLKIEPTEKVMSMNYGFDKIRFLNPVKSGSRVRASSMVLDVTDKDNGVLIKLQIEIEIEGSTKPALICEWLALHVCK